MMPTPVLPIVFVTLFAAVVSIGPAHADDNAATNYLLALLELDFSLPDYVDAATTDDPDHGFTNRLSEKQVSFLRQRASLSVMARFDRASTQRDCDWGRYASSSWSDANINDRLHRLARVVLLRARARYEAGQWIEGNRDVERVRVLARRMVLQARPFEHQCFMIENMATETAAAYLLQFPEEALDDLSKRHLQLGRFSPKKQMLTSEAERIRVAADDCESHRITVQQLLSYVRPYLATEEAAQSLGKASRQELAHQIRGLAAFMDDLSVLMDGDQHEAEEQIAQLYNRYAKSNPIIAGRGEPPVEDYRENAQGVCRGLMFGAVIDCLREGRNVFSNIDDPYGQKSLEFQPEKPGFTLVSELKYFNRIAFRIGTAGPLVKK